MSNRTNIIKSVGNFFALKGKVLTYEEYKLEEEAPVRPVLIKRTFGSWNRLVNCIGDVSNYDGTEAPKVTYTVESNEEPAPEKPDNIPLKAVVSARSKNETKS